MAKDYQCVVLNGKRESFVIQADSTESAKAEMTKRYGPEYTGTTKNWACGLRPTATPGPEKYGDE